MGWYLPSVLANLGATARRILQFQVSGMEHDAISLKNSSIQIDRTIEREGVTYDFYTRSCSCCEQLLYFIARTDGARISCFQISEEKADKLDEVIDELHESFAIDIKGLINCLSTTIGEITSKDDFPRFLADELSNYRIRTLDRARSILNRLSAEGKLEYLQANGELDRRRSRGWFYSWVFSERKLVDNQSRGGGLRRL